MLDKQMKYYRQNKALFATLYDGKYIVIKNKTVIGFYNTHEEAYSETIKLHDIGTFIIEFPSKKIKVTSDRTS